MNEGGEKQMQRKNIVLLLSYLHITNTSLSTQNKSITGIIRIIYHRNQNWNSFTNTKAKTKRKKVGKKSHEKMSVDLFCFYSINLVTNNF